MVLKYQDAPFKLSNNILGERFYDIKLLVIHFLLFIPTFNSPYYNQFTEINTYNFIFKLRNNHYVL